MKVRKTPQTEQFSWDDPLDQTTETISEGERFARLQLYRSTQIGAITYRRLMAFFGSAEEAFKEAPNLIRNGKLPASTTLASKKLVEAELRAHEKFGAHLIVEGDPEYPQIFQATANMPPVISALGDTSYLNKNTFAIVGARNGSLTGRKIAYHYAQEVSKAGFIIASGLARGIDGEAHQGSLENGTIAVVAGGIDKVYPPEHKDLHAAIAKKGLIITESPFGTEPRADLFPKRNRLIATLSRGILIIEAALKSGSLITANYAGDLNIPVFVVPGSPMDPRYAGSNELLRDGAELVTTPEDILDYLKSYSPGSHEEPQTQETFQTGASTFFEEESAETHPQETADSKAHETAAQSPPCPESEILEHLSDTPIFLDELMEACTFSTKQVMAALLNLELDERIIRHPGDRISKAF